MRILATALILLTIGAANAALAQEPRKTAEAVFAGGCFWCMETAFDEMEGVISTISGYTGGALDKPSYQQVSAGGTGHLESVKVVFDPERIRYIDLLKVYWRNVDPLDGGGQFCDRGEQYKSAIFWKNEEQKQLAEASREAVARILDKPVETELRSAAAFWPAEEYHQDYAKKNPFRYWFYRSSCGRDNRLASVWKNAGPIVFATN